MKVVYCFPFLEFFLLVTHVYASTQRTEDASDISTTSFPSTGSTEDASDISTTSFPTTGSTEDVILKTTETSPIVTTVDTCSSLEPPVVNRYTNSSINTAHPTIFWNVTVDHENCGGNINLSVNCINTENETDVATKTVTIDANEAEVSSELDSLKELTMYRCYASLKSNTLESKSSVEIFVSTIITDKIIIVNISSTAKSIFIEWAALSPETKLNYSVVITEMNAGHFSPDCGKLKNTSMINGSTEQNVYHFTGAAPDYNYSIVISSIVRNNPISSDVEFITTSAAAPEIPTNVVVRDSTTDNGSSDISKILTWDMPCHPNGRIERFDINLSGVYTLDHSHQSVMKFNYTLKKPEQEHFNKTLKGLDASTNYTLNIKAIAPNGDAGFGYETSFVTRDAIPSAPEVYIESQSSSYLDIRWKFSDGVRFGEITAYNLTILPFNPAYGKYPSNCPAQVPLYQPLNGTSTSFNYTQNVHSYWTYDIFVSADTSQGTGLNGFLRATTNTSAPGMPRNLNVSIPEIDDQQSGYVKKFISWDAPCYANDQIESYHVNVQGYYIPDGSRTHPVSYEFRTSPNQEHYDQTLEHLNGSTNYTLSVIAIGREGGEGSAVKGTFTTKDARPSAPEVYIESQSSSYLDIRWKFPDGVRFGEITAYNLYILPFNPAYGEYPSNCPAQVPLYQSLNGTSTNFTYTDAHGYWIYDIFVSADTSRGTGQNGTLRATTNNSVPGMPRNFKVSFPEIDDGSTDVKTFISWDVPCYPNDKITSYRVNVKGYYIPDEEDSPTYQATLAYPVSPDQEHYNATLEKLNASTRYILNIAAVGENGEGPAVNNTFTTRDAIPDAPIMNKNQFTVSNSSVTIVWDSPTKKAGKIIYYEIKVTPLSPLYFIPEDCTDNRISFTNTSKKTTYVFDVLPFYNYEVAVAAATQRGLGEFSLASFKTSVGVPEKVRSLSFNPTAVTQEDYDASGIIKFKRPCFTNGNLKNIKLQYTGTRAGFSDIFLVDNIDVSGTSEFEYRFHLKPEYSYQVGVIVENEEFKNTNEIQMTAPSGVPLMDTRQPVKISGNRLTGADVTLRKEQFNNSNGDIKYISLILSETVHNGGGQFRPWDGDTWPIVFNETEYQLTEDFWNPFKVDDVVTFSIGSAPPGCYKTLKYCNEPLKEDKEYFLIVRMLTKGFYKNSPAIPFKTGKSWTGFILGLIFGLLIAGVLAMIAYILWKRGLIQIIIGPIRAKTHSEPESDTRIPCKKFLQYCKNMECNPQKYQEQYALLTEKAKALTADKPISIATLPENRRKNRYTNIAPYDETRVELRIDEDDEIGSDYINASFIKGYSGCIEYIATQGPMVTTTRDFWKMVLQENVTLIAMVSQFVENDKQKCHRYFPKNHESMPISDDMEVRCSTELHFGTYCVRNLQIRKDDLQATVTHIQFLDWPDFGVPSGTDHVLQFCYLLRERIRVDGGLIIVHCSAGVGRTGTLIATDILLQSANAGKPIDVYNTVLDLRKQRVMMVQTDKQYVFIHSMLKDHLDRPPSPDFVENSEPVYENMEIIQDSRNSVNGTVNNEDESKF